MSDHRRARSDAGLFRAAIRTFFGPGMSAFGCVGYGLFVGTRAKPRLRHRLTESPR